MNSLKPDYYNPHFSHIYIEKEVRNHPVTKRILATFPKASIIEIDHYKDVFCRSHQNYRLQKQTPSLILANKHQNLVYEGAPVCQNFGNQHFYYVSSVMNCIYDCEYCYLQGMYPSANIVIFVNLEEIFEEVEKLLQRHSVYLCISYDTDLLALEHLLGYTKEWTSFALKHKELTIEVRTKSANLSVLDQIEPSAGIILAWTLSPHKIIESYEHHTPSLEQRITCIQKALQKGFKVRLCFDPMLYTKDWKKEYEDMFRQVFDEIKAEQLQDVSLGVFRVPQDYMKKMRKQSIASAVIQFPYDNDNGVYHYGDKLTKEMISFALELLLEKIPADKLYIWEKTQQEEK